jgi:hypothetical protein
MKDGFLAKCFNLGYSVKESASGAVKINVQVDKEWVTSGAKNEPYCSLTTFWNYWKPNHANIIVCKPSKDICGVCYQFHIGNRRAGKQGIGDGLNSDDRDKDAAIPTKSKQLSLESKRIARDLETLEIAKMIRQHIKTQPQ